MKNKHNSQKVAQHIVDVMQKRDPQYKDEFKQWVENNDYALDCVDDFSDKEKLSEMLTNFTDNNKEEDAKELLRKINRVQFRRRVIMTTLSMSAAVAAVAIFLWTSNFSEQPFTENTTIAEALSPMGVPTLITNHGQTVDLNNSGDIIIGTNIAINKSGTLEISPKMNVDSSINQRTNKLIVPNRNYYTIKLADGTKVVLNANSTLEFPEDFSGSSREVTLTGEGYFDVAKDANKPFIVNANGVKVRVYGTKFNISTYQNEDVTTFLWEGSVSVTFDKMSEVMLHPMQVMSTNTKNGAYVINGIDDKDRYISWIDNNFVFKATPIAEVVSQLENWYGITFDKSNLSGTTQLLTGVFCRTTDLSEMLKALQTTMQVKITEENHIYHINLKK